MAKKKDFTYKTQQDLFTVEEVIYSDGVIRYNINGKDENGTFSEGLFNDIDLIIAILVKIGKISKPAVYLSK